MGKILEFNNGKFYVQVEFEEQMNVDANTTTVNITDLRFMTTLWYGVGYYLKGALTVDSKRISVDNGGVYIEEKGKYYHYNSKLGSVTVNHLDDGTLTIAIGVEISGYTTSGGAGSGWKVVGTEDVTLTTIPRASKITFAADTVLGNACSVQWIPASAAFKYKLEFKMGKVVQTTDFIQPNTTGLYTYTDFTIPLDAAEVIPEKTQETMTVTLYTYSAAEEQIGEADTEEFMVTVPDNDYTKPTVSIDALTPVTALSSPFDKIFVQGKSKVKVSYTATGKYYATIKSCSVSIGGNVSESSGEFTSDYLGQYGTVTIKVTAVDSRGFSNSATGTIEVLPYEKPKLVPVDGESDVICTRCDASGNPKDDGESLLVKAMASMSKLKVEDKALNTASLWLKWKFASEPDSDYEEIELTSKSTGKNLFNMYAEQYSGACSSSVVGDDLVITTKNRNQYQSANFILPQDSIIGNQITVTGEWVNSGNNVGCLRLGWSNKDNPSAMASSIGANKVSGTAKTYTVSSKPDNAGELCLWIYGNYDGTGATGDTVTYRKIQVEIGNVATEYEPFGPQSTGASDSYSGIIKEPSFGKSSSFVVQIGVTDKVGESAGMTFTILSEKVYWHRGGEFLALGMRRSSGGLEVAWDTRFYGDVYVGEYSLEEYIKKIIQGG